MILLIRKVQKRQIYSYRGDLWLSEAGEEREWRLATYGYRVSLG
jgi:hypothetical protein